jgi:hypothetical protein
MDVFEYAIRKDIRNNPIIREVDRSRQRELWRWAAISAGLVLLLLVTAFQHFELLRYGYGMEELNRHRAVEVEEGRRLRLQIQVLQSPDRIAKVAATDLEMVEPARGDAIVIRRAVPAEPPARSVIARR